MPSALRKAAILITALETPAADALLAQMDPRQAAIVRSAVLSLGEVSPEEQRQVLEEFFRQQGRSGTSGGTADVTLELSSSADPPTTSSPAAPSAPPRSAFPADVAVPAAAPTQGQEEPPLAFLQDVEPAALADVLQQEHPQTAAVVLAHLPPAQAAAVLQRLASDMATEALARMASLAPLAREVLLDLAQVLKRLLAPHLTSAAALEKLSAVLEAMEQASREQVLAQLSRRQTVLARRLQRTSASAPLATAQSQAAASVTDAPTVTAFRYRLQRPDPAGDRDVPARVGASSGEDRRDGLPAERAEGLDHLRELAAMDDASLQAVLTRLDVPTLALALLGAEAPLVARVLRLLPSRASRWLRTELAQAKPMRLREIEQAQQRCLAVIDAVLAAGQPSSALVSGGAPPRAGSGDVS
jgi:flagellar motor switch protein FliG